MDRRIRGLHPSRALVICLASLTIAGQDLAPDRILLARITDRQRSRLEQIPNYTCLETITRFHKTVRRGDRLRPLDTVRLEIVYSDRREWFASPGDRSFTETDPSTFIASGMMGNGLFATALHNLFVSNVAIFTPAGREPVAGRPAVRYDFRLPRSVNKHHVSLPLGDGMIGEEGSFWADPKSLELLRMDSRAVEIPFSLPLDRLEISIEYVPTRIGELEVMLPDHAGARLLESSGEENYDRFDFSHCRAYHTSSSIRYDPPSPPTAETPSVATPAPAETRIPALLMVAIDLKTPITEHDIVGSLIEARVAAAVRHKGKVLIPEGAPVRGRIRRLERFTEGVRFAVGLEFIEVEVRGEPVRFYADLLGIEKRTGVGKTVPEILQDRGRPIRSELTLPELPGVASFFVTGSSFTLPAGFRTVWRTRGLLRGVN
jgi:hypothetical protein